MLRQAPENVGLADTKRTKLRQGVENVDGMTNNTRTRRLELDMDALLEAMARSREDIMEWFLDGERGAVVALSDDPGLDADLRDQLDNEWGRFLAIPRAEGEYDWMRDFAASVDDEELRERLEHALSGRGAFRLFRDIVFRDAELSAEWLRARQAALLAEATRWLAESGIEPVYTLRPIAAPAPAPAPHKPPPVTLLDLVLLGAPDGKTELIEGRVRRVVTLRDASEARRAFKSLARELCELSGKDWRRRFIEGRSEVSFGRGHLSVHDSAVELELEVPRAVWDTFSR
jgi:hypothetical protein